MEGIAENTGDVRRVGIVGGVIVAGARATSEQQQEYQDDG